MALKADDAMCAQVVADALDADVFLYNGEMSRSCVRTVEKIILARKRRQNLVLILVTHGGDPDAAFRLGRLVQLAYQGGKVMAYVSGMCKSAGTIAIQAANELVWFPQGELGPLDIQIARNDDLGAMDSGLTATTALQLLGQESFRAFETAFLDIKAKSGNRISFKMATEIATELTVGLFSPIYEQIQAMHLGEVGRANSIAALYGERLAKKGGNLKHGAVEALTYKYPSHSFVIDRDEADQYFNIIREPSDEEHNLVEALGNYGVDEQSKLFAHYLSEELGTGEEESQNGGPRKVTAKRTPRKSKRGSDNTRKTPRLLAASASANGHKR